MKFKKLYFFGLRGIRRKNFYAKKEKEREYKYKADRNMIFFGKYMLPGTCLSGRICSKIFLI